MIQESVFLLPLVGGSDSSNIEDVYIEPTKRQLIIHLNNCDYNYLYGYISTCNVKQVIVLSNGFLVYCTALPQYEIDYNHIFDGKYSKIHEVAVKAIIKLNPVLADYITKIVNRNKDLLKTKAAQEALVKVPNTNYYEKNVELEAIILQGEVLDKPSNIINYSKFKINETE